MEQPRGLVVVVDGPSGSGKSSAARGVAARLGMHYLDTGAMYRAATWWLLHHDIDVDDAAAVAAAMPEISVSVTTDPAQPQVFVNDVDVTVAIRERGVTDAVSAVSAVPEVRQRMVAVQQQVLADGDVVAEGRDLGTVVAPHADLKVFLTADSSARAQRRQAELTSDVSVADTQEDLLRRDHRDSTRELSPLTMADDAVLLDSTHLSLDEVVERLVALVQATSSSGQSHDGARDSKNSGDGRADGPTVSVGEPGTAPGLEVTS